MFLLTLLLFIKNLDRVRQLFLLFLEALAIKFIVLSQIIILSKDYVKTFPILKVMHQRKEETSVEGAATPQRACVWPVKHQVSRTREGWYRGIFSYFF